MCVAEPILRVSVHRREKARDNGATVEEREKGKPKEARDPRMDVGSAGARTMHSNVAKEEEPRGD